MGDVAQEVSIRYVNAVPLFSNPALRSDALVYVRGVGLYECIGVNTYVRSARPFNPLGDWSNAVSYHAYDTVLFDNSSYLALSNSFNLEPDTDDGTHWILIAQGGVDGVDGTDGTDAPPLVPRGAWDDETAYHEFDIVLLGNSSYLALDNSTNVSPDSDESKWQLFARGGTDGEDGSSGLPDGWISVKDHGAIGDGSANDTTAIQATIAAAASGKGVVFFPPGVYNYTHLDLTTYLGCITLRGVTGYQWTGNSGNTNSQPRSILKCTATDSLDGIVAFQMQGCIVQDLQFEYVTGYTGTVLNIGSNPSNNSGTGTNTFLVSRCRFVSDHTGSYNTAKAHIGMNNTVMIILEDCSFMGAQCLVRGLRTFDSFANCVVINRCQFEGCTVGQIVNPDLNWHASNCLFEFTNALTPCAITSDLTETADGTYNDIVMSNCWFWDFASVDQIPIIGVAGVTWNLTVKNSWFHAIHNKVAVLDNPGSFIFTENRLQVGVPVDTPTLIDLGDYTTALKDLVVITHNKWAINGDAPLTVINETGHKNLDISKNSDKGVWSTDPGVTVLAPSGVVLSDFNTGKAFFGGTTTLIGGLPSSGSRWEFFAVAFSGVTPVVTFPAATGSSDVIITINGTAATTGKNSITLNSGSMVIKKMTPEAYAGILHGVYDIIVGIGTYTLNT